LELRQFLLRSQRTKTFGEINPLKKYPEKNICAKNRVIFWTISYCEHKKSAQLGKFKVK